MNRRELFLSAAGAAVAAALPETRVAAPPAWIVEQAQASDVRGQPFSVFTERGLYVGCHPSPWTPDHIRAMIEAGDPGIRWGALSIPAGSYVQRARVFSLDEVLSYEELRRLTA